MTTINKNQKIATSPSAGAHLFSRFYQAAAVASRPGRNLPRLQTRLAGLQALLYLTTGISNTAYVQGASERTHLAGSNRA